MRRWRPPISLWAVRRLPKRSQLLVSRWSWTPVSRGEARLGPFMRSMDGGTRHSTRPWTMHTERLAHIRQRIFRMRQD
jgi:hypothetical protein